MIKIFIPESKRKFNKAQLARGFWKNADNKVYYDYIRPIDYKDNIDNGRYELRIFLNYLEAVRISNKQEAIFFNRNNKGYIFYGIDKKIEVLNNRIFEEVDRAELKKNIKAGLWGYNGITIYANHGRYFLEAYFND
jgi:hypothetical protein